MDSPAECSCRYVPMFGETEFDATMVYSATPVSEQLAAIQQLMSAGKVLAWGLSNETPWGVCHAIATAQAMGLPKPAMVQNAYSLLCRTADTAMFEVCHMEDVPFVGYSPLAMGLLGGGYRLGGAGSWRAAPERRLVRYKQKYAEAESRCDLPATLQQRVLRRAFETQGTSTAGASKTW